MVKFRLAVATAITASSMFQALIAWPQSSHQVAERAGVAGHIEVSFDRHNPTLGTFPLQYELGREFDRAKPTVFGIADGQQFYVKRGTVAPLQDELFGDRFNVVGIMGRGSNDAVMAKVRTGDAVDWQLAYRLLRSEQWVEDIEEVRKAIVSADGQISLYGRSGGGLLVDQYLAKYPGHVRTVFTQAAVNRFINAEFHLNSDKFWDEIGKSDPQLQTELLAAMAAHPDERPRMLLLLQRQNFFVPANQLAQARAALIHALGAWNSVQLQDFSEEYQVNAILELLKKSNNPASNVRLFEFCAPISTLLDGKVAGSSRVDPDDDVCRLFGAPLFKLLAENKIAAPSMNLSDLNSVPASVYLLAGYFDHTADYRSQIALASHFPHHRLLLLSDDHDFLALGKTGLYPQLVQAALLYGYDSTAVRAISTDDCRASVLWDGTVRRSGKGCRRDLGSHAQFWPGTSWCAHAHPHQRRMDG
jgi:pimeloyl-ACP methyl ester carboxylesterase